MRKFINVSKKKQLEMEAEFPKLLNVVNIENPRNYQFLSISVFDHVLNHEECLELLDSVEESEQHRRNDMFNKFNDILIENTDLLTFRLAGIRKERIIFREFNSLQAKKSYIDHTGDQRYKTILPNMKAVYFEGYDDTNHFYLLDGKKKEMIEGWANQVGLYSL